VPKASSEAWARIMALDRLGLNGVLFVQTAPMGAVTSNGDFQEK
jgi:hypothetical protein